MGARGNVRRHVVRQMRMLCYGRLSMDLLTRGLVRSAALRPRPQFEIKRQRWARDETQTPRE
eukprot:9436160-Pyramimonas_sp.AAC.1